MEPVADLNELTERIRLAASRGNSAPAVAPGAVDLTPGVSPLSEALLSFMGSALTDDILEQTRQMLPRARRKNEVSKTVPKLLRPLYRNQGGFNGVALEIMERLVMVSRQLAEQMGQFRHWADAAGQDSAQHRARAAAMELRLEAFRDERLVEIEVRLNRLEQQRTENRPGESPTDSPSEARLKELLARIERLEKQDSRPQVPTAGAFLE